MRNEAELEYEQMCAELDHLRECDKANRKLIAELEAREPLCRCADEVRCDYLKRIAELEAKNMDAAVAHGKQLERIAELEAKLDVFDEMDEMLRICLNANVDIAKKLDRVRGLPEKWRDISYKTTDAYTNLHGCADELQSALGDEE